MLNETQAREVSEKYLQAGSLATSTQEILDSGAIPRLRGYHARIGKVSDAIHGGPGSYVVKEKDGTKRTVTYDNPPLIGKDSRPLIFFIRTDRISSHDENRGEVPLKGQILAANHNYMLRMLARIMSHAQIDVGLPDNAIVSVQEQLTQIPVEMVVRGYMAESTTDTSLFHHYVKQELRVFCGHELPNDLVANGPLPYPMDTPSSKAGRDVSMSPEELFAADLCTPQQYAHLRGKALFAFGFISHLVGGIRVTDPSLDVGREGLIAVDTKTEHGIDRYGRILAQDELYTLDSSRFWDRKEYETQLAELIRGERRELKPRSFSKEFARQFSKGKEHYTPEQVIEIAVRYILGIQALLNSEFVPDTRPRDIQVISGLEHVVQRLAA